MYIAEKQQGTTVVILYSSSTMITRLFDLCCCSYCLTLALRHAEQRQVLFDNPRWADSVEALMNICQHLFSLLPPDSEANITSVTVLHHAITTYGHLILK